MSFQEFDIANSPSPASIKRASFIYEAQSLLQPIRLLSQSVKLANAKKGNGKRIMLIPGLKSNELAMYPLKKYLSALGYAPEDWKLGMNHGYVEKYRDEIVAQLQEEANQDKITLIGWSLGGTIAREVARTLPDKIQGVITYGSPAIGGPTYTIGEHFWDKEETKRIKALIEEEDRTNPIQVPMSIIFTKKDSIVSWAACIDKTSKNVKHYEVHSTHLSLGIDPNVWRIITNHLEKW